MKLNYKSNYVASKKRVIAMGDFPWPDHIQPMNRPATEPKHQFIGIQIDKFILKMTSTTYRQFIKRDYPEVIQKIARKLPSSTWEALMTDSSLWLLMHGREWSRSTGIWLFSPETSHRLLPKEDA